MKEIVIALKNIIIALIAAFTGAYLFNFLHAPVPWMLGPMFALILLQFFYKKEIRWPAQLRDFGLVVLGLAVGGQFDLALFNRLGILLIYMFLINITLIAGTFGVAFLLSRWSKQPLKTMILSTLPGGVGQIVTFAEEEKEVDLASITYFHMIRLFFVVTIVPFIVASHTGQKPEITGNLTPVLFLLTAIAWGCSLVVKQFKMPAATFTTPVVLMIILSFFPVSLPAVPAPFMKIAQLCIGTHIGLLLKPHMLKLPVRQLVAGIFSSIALLVLTFGLSLLLMILLGYSFTTSFLSTAPGGLDQMVLLAEAAGADVSVVTVYQIFRLLFIFLIVIPAIRFYYAKMAPKKAAPYKVTGA